MTANANLVEFPNLTHEGVGNLEFIDTLERIVSVLADEEDGIPSGEAVLHEILGDVRELLSEINVRLEKDRRGKFTTFKQKLDKERRTYYAAIRRGVREIFADPDPNLAKERRSGAEALRDVLGKRVKSLQAKTQGQTSTELRNFFTDCDVPEVLQALRDTDLMRFYTLLKTAHASYTQVLHQAGREESEEQVSADAEEKENKTGVPLRVLKTEVVHSLDLAFDLMAHHARRGREPYFQLLTHCVTITDGLNLLAKKTRNRKAKSKMAGTKPSERSQSAPPPAPKEARPASTAPSPSATTAPKAEGLAS